MQVKYTMLVELCGSKLIVNRQQELKLCAGALTEILNSTDKSAALYILEKIGPFSGFTFLILYNFSQNYVVGLSYYTDFAIFVVHCHSLVLW